MDCTLKALLQRVINASVVINREVVGEIEQGLLVFIGIEHNDVEDTADKLLSKTLGYRVFVDEDDKMNLSLQQIQGGLLLVPQFTLAANTQKGLRPSFSSAATPDKGEALFNYFVAQAQSQYSHVASGCFRADMKVHLINDGPVTFWLEA